MKLFVSICLIILLAICAFASCADTTPPATNTPEMTGTPEVSATPQASLTPQASETPILTPAENFVNSVTDDQLDSIIFKSVGIVAPYRPFSAVEEITSSSLFNFFTGIDGMDQWYNKEEHVYYVPVKSITAVLDQYFDSYTFDPAIFGPDFDEENNIIRVRAYGYDWNYESTVENKKAISDNLVQIDMGFIESYIKDQTEPTFRMRLTIKITDDGYKYISFVETYRITTR